MIRVFYTYRSYINAFKITQFAKLSLPAHKLTPISFFPLQGNLPAVGRDVRHRANRRGLKQNYSLHLTIPFVVLFTWFLLINTFCFAQQPNSFQEKLEEWQNQAELKHSSVGVYFQDANTGQVLAQSKQQLSLVPGSILKLATTAAAMEILGTDYLFKTSLLCNALIQDTIQGDLIIRGSGDPALGSEYFKELYFNPHFLDEWIAQLLSWNVKHISGRILTEATIYEEQMIPNTWIWEDIGNYYGAGTSALSVYDNMYRIHLSSPALDNLPVIITRIEPEIPGLEFDNQLLSSDTNRDRAYVFGSPLNGKRTIRGTIPKGKTDFVVKASIPDPASLLSNQLQKKLFQAGITIEGNDIDNGKSSQITIAETVSPSLTDIVKVTNHESVNLFAEHLAKQLSYEKHGLGTTKEGIKIIKQFWADKGIDMNGFFMADGSGLSRFNAMTAQQMVQVLDYMKSESEFADHFFGSIPKVPNGTLYVFERKKFPNGSLQAKSGSMTRVRCYAGQLKTSTGREILFTIMLNNFSCSQSKAIDLIEDLLYGIMNEN